MPHSDTEARLARDDYQHLDGWFELRGFAVRRTGEGMRLNFGVNPLRFRLSAVREASLRAKEVCRTGSSSDQDDAVQRHHRPIRSRSFSSYSLILSVYTRVAHNRTIISVSLVVA